MYYRHYEQCGEEVVNEVEKEGLRWSLFTLNADGSWDFWQKTDGCFQKPIRWEVDTEIKIKFSQSILNSYNHTQFWPIMALAISSYLLKTSVLVLIIMFILLKSCVLNHISLDFWYIWFSECTHPKHMDRKRLSQQVSKLSSHSHTS